MHLSRVVPQPHRFFDGGEVGEPSGPGEPLRIVLVRHVDDGGVESFSLDRTIGYDDRRLGRLLVPAGPDFRTDLTSVPWLFTWLVPRTGAHLPAALLHDGLVGGADGSVSYLSEQGHRVARDEADRVFRDAMADTGTGVIRRWLVWSAVTLATLFVGSARWSPGERLRLRLAAALTIGAVLVLGTLATLDLADVGPSLPWMDRRPWWRELVGGLAGEVVIPLVLALTWGRFRLAGAVTGVTLAVLLHVSLALLLLTGLYQLAERLAQRAPAAAAAAAALLVGCSVVVVAHHVVG